MNVEELLSVVADCAYSDEVVVVGEYGQLHNTGRAAHCTPVLAMDVEDCVDVRGRLFLFCSRIRKYPVMTDDELANTEGYG